MKELVCEDCGRRLFSAAASRLAESGERCECGGHLRLAEEAEQNGSAERVMKISPGALDDELP